MQHDSSSHILPRFHGRNKRIISGLTIMIFTINLYSKFIILPELGERVFWKKISVVPPTGSCGSIFEEDNWPLDGASCKPLNEESSSLFKPKSWLLDSSGSSKTESVSPKYGKSKTISGCLLRKLRRGSHWISFSKCFPNKPCGHCR